MVSKAKEVIQQAAANEKANNKRFILTPEILNSSLFYITIG